MRMRLPAHQQLFWQKREGGREVKQTSPERWPIPVVPRPTPDPAARAHATKNAGGLNQAQMGLWQAPSNIHLEIQPIHLLCPHMLRIYLLLSNGPFT